MSNSKTSDAPLLRRPGLTLATIAIAYLFLVVDGSIAIVSLPKIQSELGFSPASLSWVQNAYTLAFGGLLLLGARLGDLAGRLRMFRFGLVGFMVASVLVGMAPTAPLLIIGRVLQGVAGAVLGPSTLALLSTSFPSGPARARAMAVYGSITGIGTSVGLVLGGFITATTSWRWAFLINLPIGVALLIATRFALTETVRHRVRLDIVGAVTSIVAMSSLVYGLVLAAEQGWNTAAAWVWLGLGLVAGWFFVRVEKRNPAPLLPLRLMAHRKRTGANLARALFVGSMAAFWFYLSQFLQVAKGMNALQTGLAFLPMTLASFGIAFLVPRLSARFGEEVFLRGGLAVVTVGTFWLAFLNKDGSYLTSVALPMVLVGLGQGASTIRLTSAGMSEVAPEDSGAASGVVSTAVQLGSALGLSILLTVAASAVPMGSAETPVTVQAQAHSALIGGAVLCALALASVLLFVKARKN
jgi:EmrB/QacA subfamily drug resistance transporter